MLPRADNTVPYARGCSTKPPSAKNLFWDLSLLNLAANGSVYYCNMLNGCLHVTVCGFEMGGFGLGGWQFTRPELRHLPGSILPSS